MLNWQRLNAYLFLSPLEFISCLCVITFAMQTACTKTGFCSIPSNTLSKKIEPLPLLTDVLVKYFTLEKWIYRCIKKIIFSTFLWYFQPKIHLRNIFLFVYWKYPFDQQIRLKPIQHGWQLVVKPFVQDLFLSRMSWHKTSLMLKGRH